MKKIIISLIVVFLVLSVNSYAISGSGTTEHKSNAGQTVKKDSKGGDKPTPGDKVVSGKKGPDGEKVYKGSQGGEYYINKSGHKTYLKSDEGATAGTKGTESKSAKSKSKTEASTGSKTKSKSKSGKTETNTQVKQDVSSSSAGSAKGNDKPGEGDKIIPGKQGPEGQPVYLGPRGGEYYINKNGNRTYLEGNKK